MASKTAPTLPPAFCYSVICDFTPKGGVISAAHLLILIMLANKSDILCMIPRTGILFGISPPDVLISEMTYTFDA